MVETAEAYVVCGAVTGDDPLRTLGDVLLDGEQTLAYVAAASLAERNNLGSNLLGHGDIVAVLEPLGGQSLDGVRAGGALESLLHVVGYAGLELLVSERHTETELGEILEQRVCPCHTFALGVLGVGGRGYGTRVD